MMLRTMLRTGSVVLALGAVACSDAASRSIEPPSVDLAVFPSVPYPPGTIANTAEKERIEVCKVFVMTSGAAAPTASFSVSGGNISGSFSLANGECREAYVSNGEEATITETSPSAGFTTTYSWTSLTGATGSGSGTTVQLTPTGAQGFVLTFTNTEVPPPPPPVCDFITFGRLVTSAGEDKVVISGNAGGNKPGGGILGEFHIDVNGVDYHVADIDTYGPITSGALAGLLNARVVTGIAKNGSAVELRLYDGGEPGKDTDVVAVKIDGVSVLAANGQLIDQGNMQYHPNCRGPQD